MGTRDPRIDAYIEKSADFAKPILTHIREVVHSACPEVEETMKWSFPHFMHHGILCSMASFKAHCAFDFWKGSLILDAKAAEKASEGMGRFGRITSVRDLPPKKVLAGYVRQAAKLNEEGVKAPSIRKPSRTGPAPKMPEEFARALARNRKAKATFDSFPPGQQKEYVQWVADAKTEATRDRRIATAIEWLAEGKRRNWKYERKG